MTARGNEHANLGALSGRVAGAPISWGVCEVPGWGHQMPPDRVLAEMAELGLPATELGPDGYLGPGADGAAAQLAAAGLTCLGGFVPVVLHAEPGDGVDAYGAAVDERLRFLGTLGADRLVLAAETGLDGYDSRPELDDAGWARLLGRLDDAAERAAAAGLRATLHPHVGTMVETRADVERVLAGSRAQLCLDTGHLMIGGTDPAELARSVPERIGHVHLKDVDAEAAAAVRSGRLTYTEAVNGGMYRPLGSGDVDVAAIVTALESAGYTGWYVLEQDTVLSGDPPAGAGPIRDVARSLAHLASVSADLPSADGLRRAAAGQGGAP